jgi:hypothetical protein
MASVEGAATPNIPKILDPRQGRQSVVEDRAVA